ncbi:enolase C-terminal domain-like protein [Ahrensia marina]|uniref:Mandelate racemase/muconate lactonizing enzyme C-terminal domain-containing protein n=1 Tax=Ahrensia marina TaxID=1514904 RepID=A0A0N0E6T7_9HYPH|nr:enolase C-terminal domain-like protein [Ahrensia marina]KPB00372.1 hypothetical protein SU32_14035 [Ahrensia marina]
MKVNGYKVIRFAPPRDTFILIMLETDGGLTGWGEITGSGSDRAAAIFAQEAMQSILGRDPLDINACMADLLRFKVPPLRDHCAMTAFSGISQALWDINAQAAGQPLYRLLGDGRETTVPLYANLNRGLFQNRSPEAFAANAASAIQEGFAFAKATPFDELTPAHMDMDVVEPGLKRLEATCQAVGAEKVAIDCHWRFNLKLADRFMAWTKQYPAFCWIEDILDINTSHMDVAEFRSKYSWVVWAGGETLNNQLDADALLDGSARPDIFMPDVKYLWPIDNLCAHLNHARSRGCRLSLHNPSGPVSTAFSAHVWVACSGDAPVEFPYGAVTGRSALTGPQEPVQGGVYYISDKPGIGIAPTSEALEKFGNVLAEGDL